jgi:hypothetical protein
VTDAEGNRQLNHDHVDQQFWWAFPDGHARRFRVNAKAYTRTMTLGLRGKGASAVRIVYTVCLAAGTYTHSSILARHGWGWDYGGRPLGTVLFWSALTFLDPLVAGLLFFRPRLGITLLTLLMLSDVVHNTWFIYKYGGIVWMVAVQWIFLIFVLSTVRIVWDAAQQEP